MSVLDGLIASAGDWTGTSMLHDPHAGTPETSFSRLHIKEILSGRFVRLDHTWAYKDSGQEGSLLVGFDSQAGTVTAHWIDGWHMNSQVMACRGPKPDGDALSVLGFYAAPPGAEWGWRIDIVPTVSDVLRVTMFNLTPDGREELAVDARYTRA